MITAVRELGTFALNKSGKDSLSALTEVINADNYPYMLVIELKNINLVNLFVSVWKI